MAKQDKLLRQVLRARSDANIRFADLCNLLRSLGFDERRSSSHHLFVKSGVEELINLQQESGKAKPYCQKSWGDLCQSRRGDGFSLREGP